MTLALLGGPPVRSRPLPRSETIGAEEKRAVNGVLERGVLSQFLGEPGEHFYGGVEVRALEREVADAFAVRHAITTNSGTTALQTALAAIGIGPGDEVIVSPFTMSASAAAVVLQHAVPIFADIHPDTYCLDPRRVVELITERTRAIMVVDIFGQPAHWDDLRRIAAERALSVIEDAAQAAGATYRGRPAGTLGDIGMLSLNYHKIVHAGEGGILLTPDDRLAERARLIRNHGEAVVEALCVADIQDLVGSNYRLTELQCAIARVQMRRLTTLFERRSSLAQRLTHRLHEVPYVRPPLLDQGATSTYYLYAIRLDIDAMGVTRKTFVKALAAEGVNVSEGYVRPLYLQPMYQRRKAMGRLGCPWDCGHYVGSVSYAPGICPIAERMHDAELIVGDFGDIAQTERDMDEIASAFDKVVSGLQQLRHWERSHGSETTDAGRRA